MNRMHAWIFVTLTAVLLPASLTAQQEKWDITKIEPVLLSFTSQDMGDLRLKLEFTRQADFGPPAIATGEFAYMDFSFAFQALDIEKPEDAIGKTIAFDLRDNTGPVQAFGRINFKARHKFYIAPSAADIYQLAVASFAQFRCPDYSHQDPAVVNRAYREIFTAKPDFQTLVSDMLMSAHRMSGNLVDGDIVQLEPLTGAAVGDIMFEFTVNFQTIIAQIKLSPSVDAFSCEVIPTEH